jgi:hypothetical protein
MDNTMIETFVMERVEKFIQDLIIDNGSKMILEDAMMKARALKEKELREKEFIREYSSKAYEKYYEAYSEIERIIETDGKGDYIKLAEEILDEIQLRINMLLRLNREGKIVLSDEFSRFNLKLLSRRDVSGTHQILKES